MWRVSEIDKVAERKARESQKEDTEEQVIGRQREENDWAGIWKQPDDQIAVAEQELKESTVEDGVKMGRWLEEIGEVPEGCPAERFDLVWTISYVNL